MGRRGGEEGAAWAVEKASERMENGDAEGALKLLEQVQRLHPRTPGLPELVALAQVCHAASCCLAAPHWYRILMVNEKDDLTVIRKRYHQLALLLHPDKNKHARAEEAFKLVLEAYGHLSDGKKRETFDVNIRKKECGKCSCESQPFCWDSMKCNGEPLEGKINQTDFQSRYFPFDVHTAEWKIEHEKLRMFRERAQAKVDSLAQILRERRSKWNEELGTTKGKLKKNSSCNLDKSGGCSEVFSHTRFQSAAEKKMFTSQSNAKMHAALGDRGATKKAGDACINMIQRLSSMLSDGGQTSFVDVVSGKEVGSRRSREGQMTPPVLQSLSGLLRTVKEGMGGGDCSNVSNNGEEGGDKQQSRETQTCCHSHNPKHGVNCGGSIKEEGKKKKLEDEWIVIDDFLAGLNENGQPLSASTDQTFERAEKKYASSETASFVKRYSRKTPNDADSLKEQPITTMLQAHKRTLCFDAKEMETCNKLKDRIVSSAFTQNKQSEQQLLMTLERLRDESKSVAATLESMKEARIFPGNYYVPIAT